MLATVKDLLPSIYHRVQNLKLQWPTGGGDEMRFANISDDNWTFNGSLNLSRLEMGFCKTFEEVRLQLTDILPGK